MLQSCPHLLGGPSRWTNMRGRCGRLIQKNTFCQRHWLDSNFLSPNAQKTSSLISGLIENSRDDLLTFCCTWKIHYLFFSKFILWFCLMLWDYVGPADRCLFAVSMFSGGIFSSQAQAEVKPLLSSHGCLLGLNTCGRYLYFPFYLFQVPQLKQ